MSELLRFFKDMRDNGYGLAEIAAQLGTSAIAEPVAGFAAMYDPVHGADAIREGMTYQPRTQEAQQYSQSIGNAAKTAIKPAMPIIDTWKKGVDIAGQYSPVVGAGLRTVPTAIGIAMGAKPALQAGRQVSEGLGAMQGRMIVNATAPRTLNAAGFRGQRGAIGLTNDFDNSDEIKIIADYLGQSPESMLVNRDLYTKKQGAINSLVSRYEQMDDFSGAYYPTSYGYISISPSAKSNGQWQLTSFDKKMNPLSDQGEMSKNKALTEFFKTIKPNKYGNITPVQTTPKRPLTEFEQAHLLAQQRAALPVNQRGLNLPADNTPMDRARAMGFDIDTTYTHRSRNTSDYLQEINPKKDFGGIFSLADDDAGPRYGQHKHEFLLKGDVANNIADEYSDALLKKNFKEIVGHKSSSKISSNDMDTIRYALDNQSVYVDNPDRLYELLNGFDDVESFKAMQKTIGELSRKKGYGAVKMEDEFGDSTMLLHGNKVRYKDAAFDPFNRESSNLLATTAPLVPTTALGAYMYNEKRKKSQGKQ